MDQYLEEEVRQVNVLRTTTAWHVASMTDDGYLEIDEQPLETVDSVVLQVTDQDGFEIHDWSE